MRRRFSHFTLFARQNWLVTRSQRDSYVLCINGLYRTTPTNNRLLKTSGFSGFWQVSSGNRKACMAIKADEMPA